MMMTGRQLHALERPQRLRQPDGVAPLWQPALRGAGYRTCFIGKWDLPPELAGAWDHSVVWHASGRKGFVPTHYYQGMPIETNGGAPRAVEEYSTDFYTQTAVEFIRQDHQQRPWFLWLCYGAPHVPTVPPERYRDLYAGAGAQLTDACDMFGPRENVPRHQRNRSEVTRNGDRIEREFPKGMLMADLMRNYGATVRGIDDGVGRIVEALRASGQLERTLVVFTADDGMPFGEHGFINKTGPYDPCQRVPMIVRGPSAIVARGGVCRHPVGALDLIPAFCSVAGVKPPHALHGRDLGALLRDPSAAWPHPVLLESFAFEAGAATHGGVTPYQPQLNRPSPDGIPWWLLLRQGRYKYIRTLVKDEIEELYDIESDPREQHNLAVEPRHRDLLRDYRTRLDAELRRTEGEPLARNLPKPVDP